MEMAPDTKSADSAGDIIKGFSRIPAPRAVFAEKNDPVGPDENSCDRDTNEVCPEGWVVLGPLKGGSTNHCHPGSQYTGPCDNEPQSFVDMSATAKKRWSRSCQAYFPCKRCTRDYTTETCPEAWAKQGEESICEPIASQYDGPCRGLTNFAGYNTAMLDEWSEMCGAYWKCQAAGSP